VCYSLFHLNDSLYSFITLKHIAVLKYENLLFTF
jgi:hypothetical protein